MSIDLRKVILYGGGDALLTYGTLTKRTATWEEDPEHFSRAGEATFVARDGTTRIASTDIMCVEWIGGEPTVKLAFASTASTYNADRLYVDYEYPPQAAAYYLKWKHTDLSTGGGDGVLHIGTTNSTDVPRLGIYFASTGNLTFEHASTSGTVTSAPVTVPSTGEVVEALLNLRSDGKIRGHIAIDAGTVVKGSLSTASALGSTWAAWKLWLGSRGAGNDASMRLYTFAVARSTQSMADMRTAG